MEKTKIGLLPFYLKLYDDLLPDRRPRIEGFYAVIADAFRARGVEVVTVPVCRVRKEFKQAVGRFEAERVDAIVTLHLAYSPSLESAEALAGTRLPVLVLDTTPTYAYGPGQDPEELMYNHGIHGVQDMCNLLIRGRKGFLIEAGHWERSDALDRAAAHFPAARMAAAMGRGRVGLMGSSFRGMGDFHTTPAKLKDAVGARAVRIDAETMKSLVSAVKGAEVDAELAEDARRFDLSAADAEAHRRSAAFGLAVRRWIEKEKLSAFSFNFLDMDAKQGFSTAPFLEASKAMARGTGYAGEGDILTAQLVASVASAFPDATFTEMFCPDWESETVFLSHMGEVNWRLLEGRPALRGMDYIYSATGKPAFLTGRFRPGAVVLASLAPIDETRYRLVLTPAAMLHVQGEDRSEKSVHGWFRPRIPLREFLAAYSRAGGTHHLAMAYTESTTPFEEMAKLMGWEPVVIG